MLRLLTLFAITATTQAQWQLQQSHTTASLRGIHALGGGVAWASGTNGTVLRTLDDGATWQPCAIPPAAEHLDFRGIQAFDAQTAIVMSSGKGDLSRLYKSTDACQTWKLVFTNPDKEGFWDAVRFSTDKSTSANVCFGEVVGDPVLKHFALFITNDCGDHWERQIPDSPEALPGESLFAASNSSLEVRSPLEWIFVTGGVDGGREINFRVAHEEMVRDHGQDRLKIQAGPRRKDSVWAIWPINLRPSTSTSDSAGAFSIGRKGDQSGAGVIVGGDYKKPDQSTGTAWVSGFELKWTPSKTPPHGYRSAVAYSPTHKAWITVGPNGTDLSTDDGRTWRPLKPTTPNADPEEDQHWNALSLPFVVGPRGRIGKLREDAIPR